MLEHITEFRFNSMLGIFLYWLPMTFCVIGYIMRTHKNYWDDLKEREKQSKKEHGIYWPTDTLGTLVGRAVVSVLPVANLYAVTFDLAPEVFSRIIDKFSKMLNIPLVPRK